MERFRSPEISDDLLQRLKNRDPHGFDELFDNCSPGIYRLAYRMTGDSREAEDITQETFSQVYQNIDTFRGESQIYTWIFSIAKNSCYRWIKKNNRMTFPSYEEMLSEASASGDMNEYTELEKRDLIGQVKEGCLTGLVRCLSPDQRASFVMHVFLGLSIFDISRIMERSEGAIKILIHRGRNNLREFLCKNCSVYDDTNPCKCANMVDFSLKKGWISRGKNTRPVNTAAVENEIDQFKRIIDFYKDLNDPVPLELLKKRFQVFF
jgi:RNA polymerase sigma-70 factor (ECF subfamily)